ncbi:MAG: Rha family transcriptional regulator [Pseudobacteriovorax sp.]|nr:Rha family transcriptional regulator [Pseudobacteriovorax sp.]
MTQIIPTDSVLIKNDVPITTSLTIAEVFDKEHRNILRAVRKMLPNLPESWAALNFERSEYRDENGKAHDLYSLTRDAFSLLAMGFTGTKALGFKVAYIEEFNRRGELIANMNSKLPNPKRKNKHRYGYYETMTLPDGTTKIKWVTGSKTIEEMNEIENESRLQATLLRQGLGAIKKYISNLPDDRKFSQEFVEVLDRLEDEKQVYKFDYRNPVLVQRPLFEEEA